MLHNPTDAEDVVQDTWIRVYGALSRYREQQRFEAWLFHILGNVCRNANHSAHERAAKRFEPVDVADRLPSPGQSPAAAESFGDAVHRALAKVPEYNREVFLLHYVEEFSYEEIEAMMGIGRSALKMRAKRAADQLRELLGTRENAND